MKTRKINLIVYITAIVAAILAVLMIYNNVTEKSDYKGTFIHIQGVLKNEI